jgi:hypothetical protein
MDKDIATYRLICRVTNDAIDADRGSFWRTKFREKFALKEGRISVERSGFVVALAMTSSVGIRSVRWTSWRSSRI